MGVRLTNLYIFVYVWNISLKNFPRFKTMHLPSSYWALPLVPDDSLCPLLRSEDYADLPISVWSAMRPVGVTSLVHWQWARPHRVLWPMTCVSGDDWWTPGLRRNLKSHHMFAPFSCSPVRSLSQDNGISQRGAAPSARVPQMPQPIHSGHDRM